MNRIRHAGISLIEVLVVLAIIAIVTALTISAVQKVRGAAQSASCENQLRQLALAAQQFHDMRQRFPAGCEYRFHPYSGLKGHDFGYSWQSSLLPFLEQTELGRQAEANYVLDPTGNEAKPFMSSSVPTLICPADGRKTLPFDGIELGVTHYVGVAGTRIGRDDGILDCDSKVRFADIRDGSSNTLMIGERPPGANLEISYGTWYSGTGFNLCPYGKILPAGVNNFIASEAQNCTLDSDAPLRPGKLDDCHIGHFWSLHPGGANFAFADGSVRFLAYSANPIMPALATRAGGEVVDLP